MILKGQSDLIISYHFRPDISCDVYHFVGHQFSTHQNFGHEINLKMGYRNTISSMPAWLTIFVKLQITFDSQVKMGYWKMFAIVILSILTIYGL